MKHVKIQAFDCPDAWYKTLAEIWKNGDTFQVKYGSEQSLTKKLNITIEILHPETRPLVDDKAPCTIKYVQWYALKYLWSGAKEDETYTYGSRLRKPVDQIKHLIKRYIEEQNDRQVTLTTRFPQDIKKQINNKKHEPPCLTLIDTEIYNQKLHLTSYFRSWDAYAGLPANIAGIQLLNEAITTEINQQTNLNIQTGKLIFHSKNCHIYQRQYKIIQDLMKPQTKIKHKFTQPKPKTQQTNT